MSLYDVLPPPRHAYTTTNHSNPNDNHNHLTPQINHLQLEITRLNANIPPYGQRQGYIPREPPDFGDGGAFPEILIKQYPLDMARKSLQKSTSGVVPLKVNEKGEVQYDAILRENMRKQQILHSKYQDLIPKEGLTNDDLLKPSDDIAVEETERTKKALEKLINAQIESVRPTHTNLQQSAPVTVRYQSGAQSSNPDHASGATSRLIKIYDMPTDPLDPPKFKHKKLPVRPPSPPVPIMHSPPRQITVEDQRNWKIPPCVSNWKNNKGFTLPLHQRLAADGRGLYNHVINDKFAKFSEALLIAERQARKEVEARAQMKLKLSKKQKLHREKELAAMAQTAKQAAKYNGFIGADSPSKSKSKGVSLSQPQPRDTSAYDAAAARRKKADETEDSGSSDSDSESDAEERRKAYEEREDIRRDRERERKRQYRLDRKKTGKKQSVRQRERDISERIALGQFSGKQSTQSLYDNRLFNQDSGLNTGFAVDDGYDLYDKPLFAAKQRRMYRPSVMDEEVYGMEGGDVLNEKSGKIRPHKAFDGAEENRGGGRGRFEFEKDEVSSSESEEVEEVEDGKDGKDGNGDKLMEDLDRFAIRRERKGDGGGHSKGYMYAVGGGGGEVRMDGRREKVMFEVAGKEADGVNHGKVRKPGLHYTEDMRKEKERRDMLREGKDKDKESRYMRRDRKRRRSRSRSRSDSRDRDRRRHKHHRSDDRDRNRKRSRRDVDEYEERGRWCGN